MSGDEVFMRLIEQAHKDGQVTFKTDDIERDRQKLYRINRAESKNEQMSLFHQAKLKIETDKGEGTITLLAQVKRKIELVVNGVKEERVVVAAKPKRKKKEPFWIERWKKDIATARERNPTFVFENPQCRDAWEYFDSIEYAMDLYEEGDDELEEAIRGIHELFPKRLAEWHGYKKEEILKDGPLTIADKIRANVKQRGDLDMNQPGMKQELMRLLDEHERLLKLRDEEDSKKPLF